MANQDINMYVNAAKHFCFMHVWIGYVEVQMKF